MGEVNLKLFFTIYKMPIHEDNVNLNKLRSDAINALGYTTARYYMHLVRHPESLAFFYVATKLGHCS